MEKLLVVMLACLVTFGIQESFADRNTFFDSIKFIQYLDENTALEEIRNGNLDIYYDRISPDRIEDSEKREGLQVFDSTSGSYSILVNPAESQKYNPFADKEVRFALNYLIDRKLIVNELMGGYGVPIISNYGPSNPEYLAIIGQLETFDFKYNPILANEIMSKVLEEKGAIKVGKTWEIDSKPIEITIFIRSDDPVRKSIGEILSAELEKIGFIVNKDFGDLNKAFVVVYGSDPAELKWSLYTEAWRHSVFQRYDSTGLSHMYAPWFSSMPGFNDPSYWNYKNEKLDALTQKIYTGDFKSKESREKLTQDATVEGINESVRIFVASKIDQFVANEKINGIVNDFGAGVPSRFTAINAKDINAESDDANELVIGVKQIYQGAWNPVMGLTDSYSRNIWDIVSDPGTFKHPFNGKTIPVRVTWEVQTDQDEKIAVPREAKTWNPTSQKWESIPPNTYATSKVTFDFKFSNWHNGEPMDMNDLLQSLYFTLEWGTQKGENDVTFDTEFTPRASQSIQNVIGINPIDEDTVEMYVNYWHFDKGEIAGWAEVWSGIPWEISSAMERAVIDGKVSFSRSGAVNKNINWLSLLIPNDAEIIREYLQEFKDTKYIPEQLKEDNQDFEYYQKRYDASIKWIDEKNHAVISNGPFYLESYSPESRTITVKTSDDKSYPFKAGEWSEFEKIKAPEITHIDIEKIVQRGGEISIPINVNNTDSILYFLTNSKGELSSSEKIQTSKEKNTINISSEESKKLGIGGSNIKIFAISDTVLKPDFYESSFIIVEDSSEIPINIIENMDYKGENSITSQAAAIILTIFAGITIIAIIIQKMRKQKTIVKNNLSE